MNNRTITFLISLSFALTALAQTTQPCVVKQYNQKQQKTPLSGVQVEVRDAGSATSANDGAVTLQFATLKPGDHVTVRRIMKAGFEIFNKAAVDQWNISRNQHRFEIVLVQSAYFAQLKSNLTQSSTDNYKKKYEQAKAELAQLQKAGKLKEEEYRQQINDLEDQYDNALRNLDNYIDQFARIDLSEVSAEEQRILDMVQDGQIDEAVKAYEELDISGKLRQAWENKKALSEAKARIEDEEAAQDQIIEDLTEKQKREIATLKLAGGKENYDKIAMMLKDNALRDTTNVKILDEYAKFAYDQNDFKEAERFWLMCLSGCGDDPSKLSAFQNNLGNIYSKSNEFAKAEEFFLKALEIRTLLFNQDPDANRAEIAMIYNDLGNMYFVLRDYAQAESIYLKALENRTLLFEQAPEKYRADLSATQRNIGNLYNRMGNYSKAEDFYLKALENNMVLFSQDPDKYRNVLAMSQNNLGSLYYTMHEDEKAEKYFLLALENKTQLFNKNPDAYRATLASTQNNLGNLYCRLKDFKKAEENFLKVVENRGIMFAQNPDAHRLDLVLAYINFGRMYSIAQDFYKAEACYFKALENEEALLKQNPKFGSYVASVYSNLAYMCLNNQDCSKAIGFIEKAIAYVSNNPDFYEIKGEILLGQGDEQGALEMWTKIKEIAPNYLSKHNGETELHRQLKEKGMIDD